MLILQGVRFLVTPRQRSVSLISEYVLSSLPFSFSRICQIRLLEHDHTITYCLIHPSCPQKMWIIRFKVKFCNTVAISPPSSPPTRAQSAKSDSPFSTSRQVQPTHLIYGVPSNNFSSWLVQIFHCIRVQLTNIAKENLCNVDDTRQSGD